MRSATVNKLDVKLNLDVNTEESCSRILQTAIGIILFQRDQIPLCYDLLKKAVEILIQKETTENEQQRSGLDCYQLKKQRKIAIGMWDRLQYLFGEISNATKKCTGNMRISLLFGSTIYTAKEAFQIDVPTVNRNHYSAHHRNALEPILKHLALEMMLTDEFQPSGKISGPTNIFILLGVTPGSDQENNSTETTTAWQIIENYQLPINCHKYEINVSQRDSNTHLHCCKEMDVFDDLVQALQLNQNDTPAVNLNGNGDLTNSTEFVWYQIGDPLKGYKEVLIRGKSMWDWEL
ncbi:uncharacterized protein LOC129769537 [Toxorhynchites rutilus septentrionalis]|uniref:uncharacterized protein LOC129769537 n=1 Tax=Toxorhynchites rutilus septentrionalis TaxID=329112 RepID=UPI002479E095|nr:uncharacterized protein LOC129769537 [Toxorhynchites rutilus septentrionalis]